jgi:hypothetical protein
VILRTTNADSSAPIDSVIAIADTEGEFAISDIKAGLAVLEMNGVRMNSAEARLVEVPVPSGDSQVHLQPTVILPTAAIIGQVVNFSSYDSLEIAVRILFHGLPIQRTEVDSTGYFTFTNLPEETFDVLFVPSQSRYLPFARHDIVLPAGATYRLIIDELADTIALLQEHLAFQDYLAIKAIFDSNGIDVPVSSCVKILPSPDSPSRIIDLFLTNRSLTTIPAAIGRLTELRILDLSYNRLKQLPDSLWLLPKLETLNIESNQITSLGEEMGGCVSLKNFYAADNQLVSIPAEIANMQNLEVLDLGNNLLTTLPAEISRLNYVQSLNVQNNALCDSLLPEVSAWLDLKSPGWRGMQRCP